MVTPPPHPPFPRLLIFENFSNLPDFILTHLLLISKTFTIHKTKSNPPNPPIIRYSTVGFVILDFPAY